MKNNEAVLRFRKKYAEKERDYFFNDLDKISKEMDQGKKVTIDVESIFQKEKL